MRTLARPCRVSKAEMEPFCVLRKVTGSAVGKLHSSFTRVPDFDTCSDRIPIRFASRELDGDCHAGPLPSRCGARAAAAPGGSSAAGPDFRHRRGPSRRKRGCPRRSPVPRCRSRSK